MSSTSFVDEVDENARSPKQRHSVRIGVNVNDGERFTPISDVEERKKRLSTLDRPKLQQMAKEYNIKANQKSSRLIDRLAKMTANEPAMAERLFGNLLSPLSVAQPQQAQPINEAAGFISEDDDIDIDIASPHDFGYGTTESQSSKQTSSPSAKRRSLRSSFGHQNKSINSNASFLTDDGAPPTPVTAAKNKNDSSVLNVTFTPPDSKGATPKENLPVVTTESNNTSAVTPLSVGRRQRASKRSSFKSIEQVTENIQKSTVKLNRITPKSSGTKITPKAATASKSDATIQENSAAARKRHTEKVTDKFRRIHDKQFAKMPDLVDDVAERQKRHQQLTAAASMRITQLATPKNRSKRTVTTKKPPLPPQQTYDIKRQIETTQQKTYTIKRRIEEPQIKPKTTMATNNGANVRKSGAETKTKKPIQNLCPSNVTAVSAPKQMRPTPTSTAATTTTTTAKPKVATRTNTTTVRAVFKPQLNKPSADVRKATTAFAATMKRVSGTSSTQRQQPSINQSKPVPVPVRGRNTASTNRSRREYVPKTGPIPKFIDTSKMSDREFEGFRAIANKQESIKRKAVTQTRQHKQQDRRTQARVSSDGRRAAQRQAQFMKRRGL